jgi:hypothetical protein
MLLGIRKDTTIWEQMVLRKVVTLEETRMMVQLVVERTGVSHVYIDDQGFVSFECGVHSRSRGGQDLLRAPSVSGVLLKHGSLSRKICIHIF